MDLIAHRGFAGVNPENTLGAVRAASERADLVEVDVRRCGSGELVVIHDETVDRVTDATGPVSSFAADELGDLDVLDSGEGVPTLPVVLGAVPDDVGVNVELKERGTAADALAATDRVANDIIVSSFLEAALVEARAADPAVARAALFAEDPESNLTLARELDCTYVHPHLPLAGLVVEPAHAAGMDVNVWTVERPGPVPWLAELGVDGVVSDYPDVLDDR